MSKTIMNILTEPLALIDQRLGDIVSGAFLTAVGFVSGNPALIALGLSRLYSGFASTPKPPTTDSPIKTSRPPRVSAYGRSRLHGAYVLYETASDGTAVDVYAVHDGELDGLELWYLVDEQVTLTGNTVNQGADKRYKGSAVHIYYTTGATPGTAFAAIISLLPGIWTTDHRGDGVVMMALTAKAVKAKDFQETYPQNGVPSPSMVARWQKCPDPAALDPSDESGWTWTENSVRHLLHYKLVREGVDYATQIAPAIDFWIAAAEDCEDPTDLKAGGTEPRYRSCLAHNHTGVHKDVTAGLLATFDGWIAPRTDGALVVYSGRYYEPTVSIGPDEIVSYNWDGIAVDDDTAINEIVVSYVSADHDYNTVEADAWRDEDDISARGKVLSQPLEAQIPSHAQGRRLAKRMMSRAMAVNRGTVTTNVAGRIVRGERYINLHIEEAGTVFFSGPVEIVSLARNIAAGGVTFSWIEADPDIDDWNPATEEGEPAAKGDRVASEPIDAPVIVSAVFFGTDSSGSGAPGARIRVTISAPDREDLTWFARWRTVGAATWGGELQFSDVDAGASVVIETDFVPADDDVEIEVAYQVGDGRVSEWSAPAAIPTGSVTFDSTDETFDSISLTFDRT